MSVIEPGSSHPTSFSFSPVLVDTNTVLQRVLQQLSPAMRNRIILRCDELAKLKIGEEHLEEAFSQLLHLIAGEHQAGAKLYLHITCSKENAVCKETVADPRFLIQFHTNLTPHTNWMNEAEQRINNIARLLLPYNGSLLVNQLKNSGCIFCISLPGK